MPSIFVSIYLCQLINPPAYDTTLSTAPISQQQMGESDSTDSFLVFLINSLHLELFPHTSPRRRKAQPPNYAFPSPLHLHLKPGFCSESTQHCSLRKVKCQIILLIFQLKPSLCELRGLQRTGSFPHTMSSLCSQRLFKRHHTFTSWVTAIARTGLQLLYYK